ncbi:MAG: cytochrome c peroxidase [Desulfosoma sp.]
MKKWIGLVSVVFFAAGAALYAASLSDVEELGKQIMFDQKLSVRNNQSCASCHDPKAGWAGGVPGINLKGAVYPGSIRTAFGNRKPPSASYATVAPRLDYDPDEGLFFGGNFWDGRATGWELGNPAADQARGPFLNPVEQALPSPADVVQRVCASKYGWLFMALWGDDACDNMTRGYNAVALSVAAYEASREVNAYSSKYDAVQMGKAEFTDQESLGLEVFEGKGRCAACHVLDPQTDGAPRVFTDFTYDNLGIPKNLNNPFYATDPTFVDKGLGDFLRSLAGDDSWRSAPYVTENIAALDNETLYELATQNDGKFKVPSLRNVDLRPGPGFVKAYGHNGYFKSLESIVHFYNTRDVLPRCESDMTDAQAMKAGCWPAPEFPDNVNTDELGDLGLSPEEEAALVAFLKTLSDGYFKPE